MRPVNRGRRGRAVWVGLAVAVGLALWSRPAQPAEPYSLLEELKKQAEPPVLQYHADDGGHDEVQDALARDYERQGFNGSQHEFHMGTRLPYRTVYSLLCDEEAPPVPLRYRDKDGQVKERWAPFGDLYAPENLEFVARYIPRIMAKHGPENFCKLGGRYVMITADEADLHYNAYFHTIVSPAREAAWRAYVRTRYGDASPAEDTNQDGRTFNAEAVQPARSWEEVRIPAFAERFREPRVWLAFRQFLCDHLYGFIRQVEDKVNAAGVPIVLGFSGQGSVFFPGGAAQGGGADLWLQARDRLLANENLNTRWPFQMALFYSSLDRFSRQRGLPVFGWSWFWQQWDEGFCWGGYSPAEVERGFAQIFGHEVHGLLHWTYDFLPHQRMAHRRTIAFWHHWFRKHWGFLKASHPVEPEVALFYPKTAASFYDRYLYPKQDYAWAAQALLDLHVPFTVLTEEDLLTDGVGPYKVLLVLTAERVPVGVARAIAAFLDKGGVVFADADSLTLDADGRPIDMLATRFGVQLLHKYKVSFNPTILGHEEEQWFLAQQQGKAVPLPARTPYGVGQELVDPAQAQWIDMKTDWPVPRLRTFHDILTAKPTGEARVLAEYKGQPAAIETPRTLWTGFRPGVDLCATYPRSRMRLMGEPVDSRWSTEFLSAEARRGHVDLFGRVLAKAGVNRPATVLREGVPARNINVFVRRHEQTGGLLLILIDTDLEVSGAPDRYRVTCPLVREGFQAWDLTANRALEWKGRGEVEVQVPEHRARYILMAPADQVREMSARQGELLALDLTPPALPLGPVGGPVEPPLPQPRLGGQVDHERLPDGVVARARVRVANPGLARAGEPVVLPVSVLAGALPLADCRGVRLIEGICQWDDLDGDGVLSAPDEIAWQADLPAQGEAVFTLELRRAPEPARPPGPFQAKVAAGAWVADGPRRLWALDANGQWVLAGVTLADGSRLDAPAQPGFVFGFGASWFRSGYEKVEMGLRGMTLEADGPVRKRIRLRFASDKPSVETEAVYTVYRVQPADETRVYAAVSHHVKETLDFAQARVTGQEIDRHWQEANGHPAVVGTAELWYYLYRSPLATGAGGMLKLARCQKEYVADAMGRVCRRSNTNFGGWLGQLYPSGSFLQVSLRRVRGILSGPLLRNERDGLQVSSNVWDSFLTRAFVHFDDPDPDKFVDDRIEPGTRWRLDALVSLRRGYDEGRCRAERRAFADPPRIVVETVILPRASVAANAAGAR